MTSQSASSLVESARNGDVFAFQMLVDRYQLPIQRYLYRLVGDAGLARQLTLQTFLRAHSSLRRLDTSIRFEAWLYRVATGVGASASRRRRWTAWLPGRKPGVLSTEDDVEAQVLQRAINGVSFASSCCLLLRALPGFSYEEIAQILHVPLRTVRERLLQARRQVLSATATGQAPSLGPDCARVRPLLSPHLDRILAGEERADVEAHLATCSSCQAAYAGLQGLDRQLARLRGRGPSAPVVHDVMAILRGGKPAAQSDSGERRLVIVGVLLVAAVLVAGGAGVLLSARGSPRQMVQATGSLYVVRMGDDKVAVVDVEQARVTATVDLSFSPSRIIATQDGSMVYVLGSGGGLAVIDTAQNVVKDTFSLYGSPGGMALSPDDKNLYVSLRDRRMVAMLDTATGNLAVQIRVGRNPAEVAVTPDGRWVYVYNEGDGSISKIKAGADRETKVLMLMRPAGQGASSGTHPIAVAPDGRKLYVADLARGSVWTIDVQTDDVRAAAVPMRGVAQGIQVAAENDRLFVVHSDQQTSGSSQSGLATLSLPKIERTADIQGTLGGLAAAPDGSLLFVTSPKADQVIYLDAHSLEIKLAVAVGSGPGALVCLPKRN